MTGRGAYPKGLVPDLRRPGHWPSLRDSLWRHPDLVALTYGELARLVQSKVGSRPRRFLYVGSGLGHISLELARDGHHVIGVDPDAESVEIAARTAHHASRDQPLSLTYRMAEFPGDATEQETYDCVLFSRVLHHISDPSAALARAATLLGSNGRVVCVDFAHDQFGDRGAHWMAAQSKRFAARGWWPESVADSAAQEAQNVLREWRAEHHDEGLHPLAAMLDPLREHFDVRRLTWHPYLFWDVAAAMRTPPEQIGEIARRMRNGELVDLRRRRLDGVLFATSGQPRNAGTPHAE